MQRMHYQENAWNEHSLFAFFVRNEFAPTGMRVLDELYGLRQEAKPQVDCRCAKTWYNNIRTKRKEIPQNAVQHC